MTNDSNDSKSERAQSLVQTLRELTETLHRRHEAARRQYEERSNDFYRVIDVLTRVFHVERWAAVQLAERYHHHHGISYREMYELITSGELVVGPGRSPDLIRVAHHRERQFAAAFDAGAQERDRSTTVAAVCAAFGVDAGEARRLVDIYQQQTQLPYLRIYELVRADSIAIEEVVTTVEIIAANPGEGRRFEVERRRSLVGPELADCYAIGHAVSPDEVREYLAIISCQETIRDACRMRDSGVSHEQTLEWLREWAEEGNRRRSTRSLVDTGNLRDSRPMRSPITTAELRQRAFPQDSWTPPHACGSCAYFVPHPFNTCNAFHGIDGSPNTPNDCADWRSRME